MPTQPAPRILKTAEGIAAPEAWSGALRAFHPETATLLKSDGNASVFRATILNRDAVIKLWEHRTLSARLKLLFGSSRGRRHWRGAHLLMRLGIPSAKPLALAHDFAHRPPREWLVLEFVRGRTLIDILNEPRLSVKDQHTLAAALGSQIATIVSGGIYNRDHKPSNLIISLDDEQRPSITVLDTVAIRRCPPGSLRRAAQMLASLHIEPTGLNCPATLTLRARCIRETAATVLTKLKATPTRAALRMVTRLLWETAAHIVHTHGDPRPSVDPRFARE